MKLPALTRAAAVGQAGTAQGPALFQVLEHALIGLVCVRVPDAETSQKRRRQKALEELQKMQ
jgi:hypothetical protein